LFSLGFIANSVAAQPSSFIINNKYQTAKEAQFITGKDSAASMVIQSGEADAQKSILLPITLTSTTATTHTVITMVLLFRPVVYKPSLVLV